LEARLPSRPHPDRALKVVGALPVIEPALVGRPAHKSQGWSEQQLALGKTHPTDSFTRQQLKRRITTPADGGWRRRNGDDEDRPIAGRQDCSKVSITGQRSRHRTRQHWRQDRHQVATLARP